jgi:cephalosporin hydroxylase
MDDAKFRQEREENIVKISEDKELADFSREWCKKTGKYKYTYNFDWFGVPIIQFPNDMVALQEIINIQQPDLIIETGVARGGSLVYSASLLAMLDLRDSLKSNTDYKMSRKVVGIDIDIREHTHEILRNEPLSKYIELIEGSSIEQETVDKVSKFIPESGNVMVLLDSNHTHEHVLNELKFYSEFIPEDGYLLVYDTSIEFDDDVWEEGSITNPNNRTWGPGNSPLSAIKEFLSFPSNKKFEIQKYQSSKLQISVCPDGFLKRTQ